MAPVAPVAPATHPVASASPATPAADPVSSATPAADPVVPPVSPVTSAADPVSSATPAADPVVPIRYSIWITNGWGFTDCFRAALSQMGPTPTPTVEQISMPIGLL